jgi:Domain of unknown function (DUF4390)
MTDFFMPCWNVEQQAPKLNSCSRAWPLHWWLICLFMACVCWLNEARAESAVQWGELQIERGEDGIYLNTNLEFELSSSLEDALNHGLPLTFVLQAEVMRERWYWYDKQLSLTQRYIRLSYQPLSRRWRVQVSTQALGASGLGVTLGNSYDSLSDAMQAVKKINRWRIAGLDTLDKSSKQRLDLRFRLDLSQLPQALQFGNQASSDWNINFSHTLRLEDLAK